MSDETASKLDLASILAARNTVFSCGQAINDEMFAADHDALARHPDCHAFVRESPPGECKLFDALREAMQEEVECLMLVIRGDAFCHRLIPVAQTNAWRITFSPPPPAHTDPPRLSDLDQALTKAILAAWPGEGGSISVN